MLHVLSPDPRLGALVLSFAVASMALPAQAPDGGAPPAATVVTLEFPGGTLVDFVGAVRAAGEDVNVVYPEIAAQVSMPAVSLKNASVRAALEAACSIVGQPHVAIVSERSGPVGASVYALRVQVESPNVAGYVGMPRRPEVRVFSLGALTDPPPAGGGVSAETVLTALETGFAMGQGDPPKVRYHADSGLLFVRGMSDDLELVQGVLQELHRDAQRRPPPAEEKEQPAAPRTVR